jgi:hypothetical protein
MKKISLFGILLASLMNVAQAADDAVPVAPEFENADFCLFAGHPPSDVKYAVIKKIKLAKGTYGSVSEILPNFVLQAKALGGNAVIDYAGTQRFNIMPWKMIRPVLRGTAVKIETEGAFDCAKLGGTTVATVIAENKAPEKMGAEPKAPEQEAPKP